METIIRIHTDNLTTDIMGRIKKMFPHKIIKITIQQADETEYILSNPEYPQDLIKRIEEYEAEQKTILQRLMSSNEKY